MGLKEKYHVIIVGSGPAGAGAAKALSGKDLEKEGFNTWRADLDYWLCSQTDADLVDKCRLDYFERDGQDP